MFEILIVHGILSSMYLNKRPTGYPSKIKNYAYIRFSFHNYGFKVSYIVIYAGSVIIDVETFLFTSCI